MGYSFVLKLISNMKDKITIIGAGIGGLTTALTCKQKAINFSLYEASAQIKPVGAGIIIANNAMQVFQKLGISEKIERVGNKISFMKITDSNLKEISVVDLKEYESKYGVYSLAIHRGELQKILAQEVGYENIFLAKRLSQIEKSKPFKLTFEDNTSIESSIVIGADGLNSVVRNQIFDKSKIRNANQKCWRGICEFDLPKKYHNELNEAWGKGKRFGFVKISDKKVYWYALTKANKEIPNDIDLIELFDEFHTDILDIITATPKDHIIVGDIADLKPIKNWSIENVCLLGDAAHATTPNLGQGACQAVEDAYVLGKLLKNTNSVEIAFKLYQNARQKKVNEIVNTSWNIGKIAHLENSLGISIRNFLMKYTPRSINKKQLEMIFKID